MSSSHEFLTVHYPLFIFCSTIFPLTFVTVPGLQEVRDANLRYALSNDAWDWQPYEKGYPKVLASSSTMPDASIQACQIVNVFDWMTWTLCVSPNSSTSWTPKWAPALYVAATLIALFVSSLIFMVLRSLDQQVEWNLRQKEQSKLLQKTLLSLESERDSQLMLLREILPETVISVLLSHKPQQQQQQNDPSTHNPSCSVVAFESSRISTSGSLSMQDVMNLATAHKQVTVIFADIKGFTSMSSALHPSQVMLMLNDLL